jgi:DNA-binding response OmpR family regulator
LLADTQRVQRQLLARRLRADGFGVDEVVDEVGLEISLDVNQYHCLIFGTFVGHTMALDLVAGLRRFGCVVPILLVGESSSVPERVRAFSAGVDDYVAKPFPVEEFRARVRTLCRYAQLDHLGPIEINIGDLELNMARTEVRRNGTLVSLTPKEYAILWVLAQHRGAVVNRTTLVEQCWDEFADPMSNVIEVHVAALRRKLGMPSLIRTVRGTGYLLEEVGPPMSVVR